MRIGRNRSHSLNIGIEPIRSIVAQSRMRIYEHTPQIVSKTATVWFLSEETNLPRRRTQTRWPMN